MFAVTFALKISGHFKFLHPFQRKEQENAKLTLSISAITLYLMFSAPGI